MFAKGGQDLGVVGHDEFAAAVKNKSCFVVDVREPDEFAAGRVPGAINQPLSQFDPERLPKDKPVILICRSGGRSANALSRSRAAGREDVRHYAGGTAGWQKRGEPIER
jgi:rhodanese-related sulfurtransferase